MADSNITKSALANALKELMKEKSFQRITISDICDYCDMSRKSFYYHFKDKYDLVNWIFDSEYLSNIRVTLTVDLVYSEMHWDLIENLCKYFYTNKSFYSKVFRVKGQNCFTDYFRELVNPLLEYRVRNLSNDPQVVKFCTAFFADAFMSALERWIVESHDITPETFVSLLKACVDELPLMNP